MKKWFLFVTTFVVFPAYAAPPDITCLPPRHLACNINSDMTKDCVCLDAGNSGGGSVGDVGGGSDNGISGGGPKGGPKGGGGPGGGGDDPGDGGGGGGGHVNHSGQHDDSNPGKTGNDNGGVNNPHNDHK